MIKITKLRTAKQVILTGERQSVTTATARALIRRAESVSFAARLNDWQEVLVQVAKPEALRALTIRKGATHVFVSEIFGCLVIG